MSWVEIFHRLGGLSGRDRPPGATVTPLSGSAAYEWRFRTGSPSTISGLLRPVGAMLHDGPVLHLGHLNITVRDTRRSAEFYARWFGFDRPLADYEDGTRFMTDASGFELALHPGPRPSDPAGDWHLGLVATEPGEVRELMSSLAFAGVRVSDPEDEPGYVGFKCRDPDGYLIEVYWEPRA